MRAKYRSSIPRNATERVASVFPGGAPSRAEYFIEEECVGVRSFHECGAPLSETPMKNGRKHGVVFDWYDPGVLTSSEPYRNGLPDGVAKQWDALGRLLGTYGMSAGTGLDLWWQPAQRGRPFLSEARYVVCGKRHGFEWWRLHPNNCWPAILRDARAPSNWALQADETS